MDLPQLSGDPSVEVWWSFDAPASGGLVIPDGRLDVVLRQGRLHVVGPMTRAVCVPVQDSPVSGIRFRPGAVARWLGCEVSALRDQIIPASAFSALRAAGDLGDVLDVVSTTAPLADVRDAARLLCDDPDLRIDDVARALDVSVRQLHRLFLAEIGLAPKVFARIQRLQRLAARMVEEPGGSLASAASAVGYTDQPHMNRDVAALCGMTPRALRRALSDSPTQAIAAV